MPAGASALAAFVQTMRISHWSKNGFVLIALLFSGRWLDGPAWAMALGACLAFSLVSSGIYFINDLADRTRDRAHPTKCHRPIAAGRLTPSAGLAGAAGLLLAGWVIVITLAVVLARHGAGLYAALLAVWVGCYFALNLGYSLSWKGRPILDVLIVAAGFVLRAMAGAAAIAVVVSPWLVVCTFMLCLFIALAKRRSEIAALGAQATLMRRVHRFYTLSNLEHMLSVSAGLAIVTYSLYCLAPRTIEHVGSANLVWTIPLVVYGMFRYYCLTLQSDSQDVARLLLRDKVMWAVVLAWVVCVAVVLSWGRYELLKGILQ
jgi:4-hydroxybenzoate polyprenyltransferase